MKRIAFLTLSLLVASLSQAQQVDKYWVTFTDKPASSVYTLDNPTTFLGERAIARRQAQNIAIDSLDLPVCQQYIDALTRAGFRVQNRSKWLNGVAVFVPEGSDVSHLDTMPFVRSYKWVELGVEKVPNIRAGEPMINTNQRGHYLPYNSKYYNKGYRQIKQLGGIDLHRAGYEGQGMVIGVCDGGFPGADTITVLAKMRNEGRLLATRDFVWDGDSVFSVHDHGTVVLSTMASYDPGLYVGTAPKASYILCRTENTTLESLLEEYNWVAAAEYLDSMGADIITTSLGYFYFDYTDHNHSLQDLNGRTAPMSIGAAIAVSRGMLVINAAGNDGGSDPQHLNAPADVAQVLTVGACTSDGERAGFSSYGPTADNRIKPDVLALGADVNCVGCESVVHTTNGTSLSTPILAGMMACLWQRYPQLTPAQLCDSVRCWGNNSTIPDNYSGYGIPDFSRAMAYGTTASIEGIDDTHLKLFPNPVHAGQPLQILTHQQYHTVAITDMMGRTVLTAATSHNAVMLPAIPAGVYLLRLIGANESQVCRLVVQ